MDLIKLAEYIADPTKLILLIIIIWLLRQNTKCQDLVQDTLIDNTTSLGKLATLIEFMIYGRNRDARDD